MNLKRIVITGGPASGKTSIIKHLKTYNYTCLDELSRQVTLEARKNGIEQLFLSQPLLFSELLIKGRLNQYHEAKTLNSDLIFFDRGLPDITAYLDYSKTSYPKQFSEIVMKHRYDLVFVLEPWEAIFESDNERYENFEQAKQIHYHLLKSYEFYNYKLIEVPKETIHHRMEFILNYISIN